VDRGDGERAARVGQASIPDQDDHKNKIITGQTGVSDTVTIEHDGGLLSWLNRRLIDRTMAAMTTHATANFRNGPQTH
jgi:hypothetical protein